MTEFDSEQFKEAAKKFGIEEKEFKLLNDFGQHIYETTKANVENLGAWNPELALIINHFAYKLQYFEGKSEEEVAAAMKIEQAELMEKLLG